MLEWGANEVVQVRLTVNRAPTGLQLTGTAQVGATLTADISGLTDADGLPSDPADYNYQWIRVDGSTETDISGATGQEYSPVVADQTKRVTMRVSYDDDPYGRRDEVERFACRFKGFRGLAIRYVELDVIFLSFIHLALIDDALQPLRTAPGPR